MADLPQNLSYSGSFDPMGKIKPFSNLTGALKKPTTPQVTTPTATQSAGMIGGESLMDLKAKANSPSLSFSYTPKKTTITEIAKSPTPLGKQFETIADRPAGADIIKLEEAVTRGSTAAEEYSLAGMHPKGFHKWETPSDNLSVHYVPLEKGGGSYIVDNENPDAIIRSNRGTGDSYYDAKKTKMIRGGISNFAEVDHIVPLWLGGRDNEDNLQILSTSEHNKKTKQQAVILTLLRDGRLGKQEAFDMALNWREYNVKNIDKMPDDYGAYDSEYANKIFDQWQKKGIALPTLKEKIQKTFRETIPEKINKNLGDSLGASFLKGFISGGTMGVINTGEVEGIDNKIARGVGEAASFLLPFSLFGKGVRLAGKGVSYLTKAAKGVKSIDKLSDVTRMTLSEIPQVKNVLGNSKLFKVVDDVSGMAEAGTGKAIGSKIGLEYFPIAGVKMTGANAGKVKFVETLKNMGSSGLMLGGYGVASRIAREGLTGVDEDAYGSYLRTFTTGFLDGSLLGFQKQNLLGYLGLGAGTYTLGMIDGLEAEDNFVNVLTSLALHATGSQKAQRLGIFGRGSTDQYAGDYSTREGSIRRVTKEMNIAANNAAVETIRKYDPTFKRVDENPDVHNGFIQVDKLPNVRKFSGEEGPVYSPEELNKIRDTLLTNVKKTAQKEGWSKAKELSEKQKVLTRWKQLTSGDEFVLVGNIPEQKGSTPKDTQTQETTQAPIQKEAVTEQDVQESEMNDAIDLINQYTETHNYFDPSTTIEDIDRSVVNGMSELSKEFYDPNTKPQRKREIRKEVKQLLASGLQTQASVLRQQGQIEKANQIEQGILLNGAKEIQEKNSFIERINNAHKSVYNNDETFVRMKSEDLPRTKEETRGIINGKWSINSDGGTKTSPYTPGYSFVEGSWVPENRENIRTWDADIKDGTSSGDVFYIRDIDPESFYEMKFLGKENDVQNVVSVFRDKTINGETTLLKIGSLPTLSLESQKNLNKQRDKYRAFNDLEERKLNMYSPNMSNEKMAQFMDENGLPILRAKAIIKRHGETSPKAGEISVVETFLPDSYIDQTINQSVLAKQAEKQAPVVVDTDQDTMPRDIAEDTATIGTDVEPELTPRSIEDVAAEFARLQTEMEMGKRDTMIREVIPDDISGFKNKTSDQMMNVTETNRPKQSSLIDIIETPTAEPTTQVVEPVTSTVEPTKKLARTERSIQKIVEQGDTVNSKNFTNIKRGKKGYNDLAIREIRDVNKLDGFTREDLTLLAKEVSGGNLLDKGAVKAGEAEFVNSFENMIKERTGNPDYALPQNKLREIRSLYNNLVTKGSRKSLKLSVDSDGNLVTEITKGPETTTGETDILTNDYIKKNNLPEDALELVMMDAANNYSQLSKVNTKGVRKEGIEIIADAMTEKGYVPLGLAGKGLDKAVFVKYDKSLVDKFNKAESKYIKDGEVIGNDYDKFLRVYAVDVLGLPKDIDTATFNKRTPLVASERYNKIFADPNEKFELIVAPAKGVNEMAEFSVGKEVYGENYNPETVQSAIDSYNSLKKEDGAAYAGPEIFEKLVIESGLDPEKHQNTAKVLIKGFDKDGNAIVHKIEVQKVSKFGKDGKSKNARWEDLKEDYGVELGDNQILSFDSNAKIGIKDSNGGAIELPLSSIFTKDVGARRSVSKEAGSYVRKFTSTEGVKEEILPRTKKEVEKINSIIDDINATKNNKELRDVFEKHKDEFNFNEEDIFVGNKIESFEHGAAKGYFANELNKMIKNKALSSILRSEYERGTMVSIISPSKGSYPSKTGRGREKRPVALDEIVIGREQMKSIGVKEGDYVMVKRDPSYDISNMAILKVIDGDKSGVFDMGKESGFTHPFVERMVLQADQDGDKMHIVPIGDGGISQKEADIIRERGKEKIPFKEAEKAEGVPLTLKNLKERMAAQSIGDNQTSLWSTQARIMPESVDNEIFIRGRISDDGKDFVLETLSDKTDQVLDTTILKDRADITPFEARPRWTNVERQKHDQMQRYAVDSKSSNQIVKESDNNDPFNALKNFWDLKVSGDKKITGKEWSALNNGLRTIQAPYNVESMFDNYRSISDLVKGQRIGGDAGTERDPSTGIVKTLNYYQKMKDAGIELTPLQEQLLLLREIKDIDIPYEQIRTAQQKASSIVKKMVSDGEQRVLKNPKVIELRDIVLESKEKIRKLNLEEKNKKDSSKDYAKLKREARDEVTNKFLDNLDSGMYTEADLNNIAYWAITSPDANIANRLTGELVNKNYPQYGRESDIKYIHRPIDLINSSETIAPVYYNAIEDYINNQSNIEKTGNTMGPNTSPEAQNATSETSKDKTGIKPYSALKGALKTQNRGS